MPGKSWQKCAADKTRCSGDNNAHLQTEPTLIECVGQSVPITPNKRLVRECGKAVENADARLTLLAHCRDQVVEERPGAIAVVAQRAHRFACKEGSAACSVPVWIRGVEYKMDWMEIKHVKSVFA